MATQTRRCDSCRRLISHWVKELGFTIGYNGKSYCRFCYVRMRDAGKLRPRKDDAAFLAGITWELELIKEIKSKRLTVKQVGQCPACQSNLSFNLRGQGKAEGICPKCNRHIQMLQSGKIRLVPDRASLISAVNSRMGTQPKSVENVYAYLIDEIAARLSEHPIVGIPELGSFHTKSSGSQVEIKFNPSRRLRERVIKCHEDAP